MHFKLTFYFLVSNVYLLCASPAAAQGDEWPQFRGPGGQGHSTETGLPLQWSETQNVAWKVPVPGRGWSSPVVASGRIWLTTAVESAGAASLRVVGFDARTGKEVVNTEAFSFRNRDPSNPKNSYASPTPIVEPDRVYVHFGADGTAALDTSSGKVIWKIHLPYQSQHGNGGSPALYQDLLIINCDGGDQAYVVALDKATGKIRWKTQRRYPADQAYTTPLVIRVGERDQLVSVGAYRAAAYDPTSGKEIWRVSYGNGFSNVPRPVYGHGLVYIATGFQQPTLLAVRSDGTGDVTKTHVAWTMTRAAPYTPSPLLVGNELYVISDLGIVSCLDATTGTAHWQQRIGGNHSASPIFADGRIYFLSEEGVATVIAPGKEFRKLATSELDGATLASMAVSGGSIFIRSHSHLYRLGAPLAQASDDMVRVPDGTFVMGTDSSRIDGLLGRFQARRREMFAAENPAHTVKVDAFFMDRTEVTTVAFRKGASAAIENGDLPVTNVSWGDAAAYCASVGKRLPTEAEWEFAAGGGRPAEFPWGDEMPDATRANWTGTGIGSPARVGSYPPNVLGLHDMSGNVWEYVQDRWTADYSAPADVSQSRRVIRGGSFGGSPVNLRVRYRDSHPENGPGPHVGFRCAR